MTASNLEAITAEMKRVRDLVDLKSYCDSKLTKRGPNMYNCPFCGSGTGKKGTAAFGTYTSKTGAPRAHCQVCKFDGDIFDLDAKLGHSRVDDKKSQLESVARYAGIILDDSLTSTGKGFQSKWPQRNQDGNGNSEKPAPKKPDYSEGQAREALIIEAARIAMKDCAEARAFLSSNGFTPDDIRARGFIGDDCAKPWDYLRGRGFTDAEIESCGFGWIPGAGGATDENGVYCERGRVLIPWAGSTYYHADRATAPNVKDGKYHYPKRDNVGERPLYNSRALDSDVFFFAEGALDAMAINLATGYEAVAVGGNNLSKANADEITSKLSGRDCVPVVMLDTDERGEEGAGRLIESLEEKFIPYLKANPLPDGAKDAADLFASNRMELVTYISGEYNRAVGLHDELMAKREADIRKSFSLSNAASIAYSIYNCEGWKNPIPTGLYGLDNALNGGLRMGLSILGAVSSAGKTTLLLQIADYIAASGWPVMFVSIEQSARELVAKSLSRLMAQRDYKGVTFYEMADTRYRPYTMAGKETALMEACTEYADTVAPNLSIMSVDRHAPTVDDIRRAAEYLQSKDAEHRPPVCIVDYLQLIQAPDIRMTDKQATDANVTSLRFMAKELQTPVIVISSLNRASYNGTIELDSFKESGSIEYSSDVLMGLQPLGIKEYATAPGKNGGTPSESQIAFKAREKVEKFKHENPRRAEIVILKNRTGALPDKPLPITFYPDSSLFIDG